MFDVSQTDLIDLQRLRKKQQELLRQLQATESLIYRLEDEVLSELEDRQVSELNIHGNWVSEVVEEKVPKWHQIQGFLSDELKQRILDHTPARSTVEIKQLQNVKLSHQSTQ